MFRYVFSLLIDRIDLLVVCSLPLAFEHCTSAWNVSEWGLKRPKLILLCSWWSRSGRISSAHRLAAFASPAWGAAVHLVKDSVACWNRRFELHISVFFWHSNALTQLTRILVFFLLINYHNSVWILTAVRHVSEHLWLRLLLAFRRELIWFDKSRVREPKELTLLVVVSITAFRSVRFFFIFLLSC